MRSKTTLAALLVWLGLAPHAIALPNGVASGDVTQNSAVVWSRLAAPGMATLEVATDPGFSNIIASQVFNVANAPEPFKLPVSGLTPATDYFYRATTAGDSGVGQFRTAAAAGRNGLRFGVSGDWRGELSPYPGIANAPGRNLDFFVALGDTIYADVASPAVPVPQAMTLEEYRLKNSEVYSAKFGSNALGDLRASTPIYATIDDHEVTNDFAGGAPKAGDPRFAGSPGGPLINQTELYNNGLQAFVEYNPINATTYSGTGDARFDGRPKLYRTQTFGSDAAMFVLDARSFRDQELVPADVANPLDVGRFITQSFDPSRTMLGRPQVQDLKNDLLQAQQDGVTWKFVMVPEPIQNLGVLAAQDRFEGYAAERTEILKFVNDNHIQNVVFVAADIHGTIVNNLTYQEVPFGPQIATNAWEITTGSLAYSEPFGPTVVSIAQSLGLLPPGVTRALYDILPPAQQEALIVQLLNGQLSSLGYTSAGLQDSKVQFQTLVGGPTATNSFGWTEFEIDPITQALTVTTWGIPAYTPGQVDASILSRQPQIISQFVVFPELPEPATVGLLGVALLGLGRRSRLQARR